MLVVDWQSIALVVYVVLAVALLLKQQQLQWLWFSVLIWLFLGILSARVMPHVLGITHWANLLPVHTYLFLGSAFFWVNRVERVAIHDKLFWQNKEGHVLITLFANSLLVMHLAFLVLTVLVYWHYPDGLSVYTASFLLRLYLLDPLNWLLMQSLMMLMFYGHRRIAGERADYFSGRQLKVGFLCCLVWLVAMLGYLFIHLIK